MSVISDTFPDFKESFLSKISVISNVYCQFDIFLLSGMYVAQLIQGSLRWRHLYGNLPKILQLDKTKPKPWSNRRGKGVIMGKVRRCGRCGRDAWIVAEIMPGIPPLCPPCFEHIRGGENFSRVVDAISSFRSVRLAESEDIKQEAG